MNLMIGAILTALAVNLLINVIMLVMILKQS